MLQLLFPPAPTDSRNKKESEQNAQLQPSYRDLLYDLLFTRSSSKRIRNINIAFNALLFVAVIEFTLTPFLDTATDVVFTRIGAVYPDSVKVVVRYPAYNATHNTVHLLWRQVTSNPNETEFPWRDGPVFALAQEEDWVQSKSLAGLWPSTSYECESFHSLYCILYSADTLADTNRTILAHPSAPIPFRTFPDPRLPTGTKFKFLASSCITINFPYAPLHGRTIKGFDLLANYLSKQLSSPEFLMFLGDFIYADVPIYPGSSQETYNRLYRRNYNSPSFRKIYERLRAHCLNPVLSSPHSLL